MVKAERMVWLRNPWFDVMYYGFCPNPDVWEEVRAWALADAHVELGEYPVGPGVSTGMVSRFKDGLGNTRVVVSLAAWLDDEPVKLMSTLVHECGHVLGTLLEKMDDQESSEEFNCYVMGALVTEMLGEYEKTRGKLKVVKPSRPEGVVERRGGKLTKTRPVET